MSKAESVILASFFFALYMGLFGFGIASPSSVNSVMNQLLSGPPSFSGAFTLKNCAWSLDPTCFGSNVATATGAVAIAISYPAILVVWFFNKVGLFFNFLSVTILGPQQGAAATPFISLFWGALLVYVIFEAMKIFRGNSIAGV